MTSSTFPSAVQTHVAMLPCSVRLITVPFPKSIVTIGTSRTLSQAGSNVWLMYWASSADENNTVLARRALVQQNCLSSCPIMWNKRTGFPDVFAASHAAANDACHLTSPALTVGLTASLPGRAAGPGFPGADARATTPLAGNSISPLRRSSTGADL